MAVGPAWFHGIDALVTLVFCIVTGIVMLQGYRAYRFFKDERYRLHSLGFFFLSASYLLIALTHLLVAVEEAEQEMMFGKMVEIKTIIWTGFTLHALLFVAGLTFLLILYLKIQDKMVRALLFIIILFSIALNDHVPSMFYFLLATLLLFIIVQIVRLHTGKWYTPGKLVVAGFSCIFIGEVLLGSIFISESLYVASHVVTLIGFLCILTSQMMVRR